MPPPPPPPPPPRQAGKHLCCSRCVYFTVAHGIDCAKIGGRDHSNSLAPGKAGTLVIISAKTSLLLLRSSKPRFRTSVWSKLPESDARSVGYYLTSGGRSAGGSGRERETGFHVIYCFYPLLINWISEWDERTNYRALQSVTDDCGSMPTPTWSSGEVPDA